MADKIIIKKQADMDEIEDILFTVEEFGEQEGWPRSLSFKVQLAVEELGINVAKHGRGDEDEAPEIEITVTSNPNLITIDIEDTGRAFDPLTDAPDPDLTSPVEDRPIGGLGIHFVREMMDEIAYRREDDKNCLALTLRRE